MREQAYLQMGGKIPGGGNWRKQHLKCVYNIHSHLVFLPGELDIWNYVFPDCGFGYVHF